LRPAQEEAALIGPKLLDALEWVTLRGICR
jgi:hypothetical protein